MDDAGEQYGAERLAGVLRGQHALPPDRALAALLDDVGRFRGRAPVADDLTVMVVRRDS